MAIPDGSMYHGGDLSAGKVERQYEVLTEAANTDIGFGTGVSLVNGLAVQATKAPIYGVAVKREYSDVDHFYPEDIENDKWHPGEVLNVLTDGTIYVQVSEDVDRGELATVDADGRFKPTTADDAVGRFLSSADKDSTARLLVRTRFGGTTGGADPTNDDVHAIQPPETPKDNQTPATKPTNNGNGSDAKEELGRD